MLIISTACGWNLSFVFSLILGVCRWWRSGSLTITPACLIYSPSFTMSTFLFFLLGVMLTALQRRAWNLLLWICAGVLIWFICEVEVRSMCRAHFFVWKEKNCLLFFFINFDTKLCLIRRIYISKECAEIIKWYRRSKKIFLKTMLLPFLSNCC